MSIFERLCGWLGWTLLPGQRIYHSEQRLHEEVAPRLLDVAKDCWDNERVSKRWNTLSRREQQVTALICLDYTNLEISKFLNIAPATVKSHTHNILYKFCMQNRRELRRALSAWNFKQWKMDMWGDPDA